MDWNIRVELRYSDVKARLVEDFLGKFFSGTGVRNERSPRERLWGFRSMC